MAGGNNNVGINHVFPMSLVKDWQKERKDTSLTSFGIIFWGICLEKIVKFLDRVLPKASNMKRKVMRFKLSARLDYWLLAGWLKESQCTQSPTASELHRDTSDIHNFKQHVFEIIFLKNTLSKILFRKYTG